MGWGGNPTTHDALGGWGIKIAMFLTQAIDINKLRNNENTKFQNTKKRKLTGHNFFI